MLLPRLLPERIPCVSRLVGLYPQPASHTVVDEIDPNFPWSALSVDPVCRDNVRHSSGATSSCSCQTTTARTVTSNRRQVEGALGLDGSAADRGRRDLDSCLDGPALLPPHPATPRRLYPPCSSANPGNHGVSRLKPCALGIHARYPSLASDTRCALPCPTSVPAKAFEPVRALRSTDWALARRRQLPHLAAFGRIGASDKDGRGESEPHGSLGGLCAPGAVSAHSSTM
jgi:hypothetical protein